MVLKIFNLVFNITISSKVKFIKFHDIIFLERNTTDKELGEYLNACFEEYRILREEIKQCSINMITSLSIGIGGSAILALVSLNLFGGDIPTNNSNDLIILLSTFCIIIPFLLGLVTAFWLGEVTRLKQMGNYLCFNETKISMLLDDFYKNRIEKKWQKIQTNIERKLKIPHTKSELGRPLQWEIWLRSFDSNKFFSTSGHMKWIYLIRLGVLFISFTLSWLFGLYLILETYIFNSTDQFNYLVPSFYLFGFCIFSSGVIYFYVVSKISYRLAVKQEPIILSEIFSLNKNNEKNQR